MRKDISFIILDIILNKKIATNINPFIKHFNDLRHVELLKINIPVFYNINDKYWGLNLIIFLKVFFQNEMFVLIAVL